MNYPKIVLHQTVYNRPIYTETSIRSIAHRTHYPNFEWIVSNVGSDQETTQLLKDLRAEFNFTLLDHRANVGQWLATQQAWDASTAPLLSKTDNDIIVPTAWLLSLYESYQAFNPFLVGAYHFGVRSFPPLSESHPNGLGIVYVSHIGGTCFLMHRDDWIKYGRVPTDHPIFGFTQYQAQAAKRGAKIGYASPPIKIFHMDQSDYPFSLRETTYKAETDRVYFLRHGKIRKPNEWP